MTFLFVRHDLHSFKYELIAFHIIVCYLIDLIIEKPLFPQYANF